MQAERHQVVHQVVAVRDAVEYVVDQRGTFREPKWALSATAGPVLFRNHSAAPAAALCVED
jgi:hypothetical protein